MKVKVLKTFRDKHTRELHKADKVMEITKERFEEILTVGNLVEEIPEKKTRKTTKKTAE